MQKIFIYGLTTFILTGCLGLVPKGSTNNQEKVYQSLEDIAFVDIDNFDKNLSESMLAKTKAITVTMLAKISVNQIPERLNKWLSAISEQKGRIYIEPRTTSMSSALAIYLLPKVYNLFVNNLSYNAASDYNATIFYNLDSGIIKKVVFSKKE